MKYFIFFMTQFLVVSLTALDYNEAIDGELSDDRLAPTVISLDNGSNLITATSVAGEKDFYTITIPEGGSLDALVLTAYESDNVSFIAFQEGSTFSENPTAADLLGYSLLGLPLGDKLPEMLSNGEIGFDIPLGPGTYTFWSQETNATIPSTYTLDFQVTAPEAVVPTLGQWTLICLGLMMLTVGCVFIRTRELQLIQANS